MQISKSTVTTSDTFEVTATLQNTGTKAGDEVAQLYITDVSATDTIPIRELHGFKRIHLTAGQSQQITFNVTPHDLSFVKFSGRRFVEPGDFILSVGGGQPGAKQGTSNTVSKTIPVGGSVRELAP